MIEAFKISNGLSSALIINEVFTLKSNYHNLRNFNLFETYVPKSKPLNSSVYRANQLWQLVMQDIRKSVFHTV